jgi:hypothetical protein
MTLNGVMIVKLMVCSGCVKRPSWLRIEPGTWTGSSNHTSMKFCMLASKCFALLHCLLHLATVKETSLMTHFITAEGPKLRTASLQGRTLLLFHLFNTNELVILQTYAFRYTGLFISPSGNSDPCGTVAGMVTPKGTMSTEGETLQVSVLPYRYSICASLVTRQMSIL